MSFSFLFLNFTFPLSIKQMHIGGGTGGGAWAQASPILFLGMAGPPLLNFEFRLNKFKYANTISIGCNVKVNRLIAEFWQYFFNIICNYFL